VQTAQTRSWVSAEEGPQQPPTEAPDGSSKSPAPQMPASGRMSSTRVAASWSPVSSAAYPETRNQLDQPVIDRRSGAQTERTPLRRLIRLRLLEVWPIARIAPSLVNEAVLDMR
jgi:hypothetical protein